MHDAGARFVMDNQAGGGKLLRSAGETLAGQTFWLEQASLIDCALLRRRPHAGCGSSRKTSCQWFRMHRISVTPRLFRRCKRLGMRIVRRRCHRQRRDGACRQSGPSRESRVIRLGQIC